MKMSSIHALQSSTTSHKLLESVRSLRPLLCRALRASGCDTIDISEQEPALHGGEGLQNEDVQYLNSHASGQHHDIYAQCLHVEELAHLHSISSYGGGHIHDHDMNAEYHGHIHVDQQVQHCNPAPQSHNYANDGDAAVPFVDVQYHGYGHYHDAHHQGYGKYGNAEYGHYGNVYPKEFEHHGDAHHHGHVHHRDTHHHHGHAHHRDTHRDAHHHGHEHGYNSNSIIMSTDNLPRIMDYRSELPGVQKYQEQNVQMKFWHSFNPMARESSVNVDPHTQYPQADYHLLDHQHIHAYHNHHLQQPISSETTAFMNTVLLEAPASYEGSISDEARIGAEASNKSSNNNNECVQDSSRYSMNNVEVHEAFAGHQAANCRELPPLPKSRKHRKRLPKAMSKRLESSGESEGTDNEEGGKLLGPKGKPTANLFSERRRRKKWNEALYALRALVPIVSKMDKLSIVGDTLTYLHQLKDKVDNLQNDICSLQTEKEQLPAPSQEGFSTYCTSQEMETGKDSAKHKILELDVLVADMEQKAYHLCIRCEREDLVLLELTKALEALNFNMLNANIAVTNENQILYTVVVKMRTYWRNEKECNDGRAHFLKRGRVATLCLGNGKEGDKIIYQLWERDLQEEKEQLDAKDLKLTECILEATSLYNAIRNDELSQSGIN